MFVGFLDQFERVLVDDCRHPVVIVVRVGFVLVFVVQILAALTARWRLAVDREQRPTRVFLDTRVEATYPDLAVLIGCLGIRPGIAELPVDRRDSLLQQRRIILFRLRWRNAEKQGRESEPYTYRVQSISRK